MPLERIYLTRHGHRLNWTIDHKTGTYYSRFPTPTGNPADPTLTSHGVRQSEELAAYLSSPDFEPKPWRIYCSPFYRCLQTIKPSVEALKKQQEGEGRKTDSASPEGFDLDVRIENGLGEWFGASSFFHHPSPAAPSELATYFPTIMHSPHPEDKYTPHIIPSTKGETMSQLHNRLATALASIIADVDIELASLERDSESPSPSPTTAARIDKKPRAILICSHAASLIAMGRALTGNMPDDPNEQDFNVFTAGLSTFVRRGNGTITSATQTAAGVEGNDNDKNNHYNNDDNISDSNNGLAAGTKISESSHVRSVPDWMNGKGVGGGWDCVSNGDCSFLRDGEERGWHFNGEESFDTGPMSEQQSSESPSKL